MNIGFWSCIILVIPFVIIGVLFAIFKEKATKFVSGFNSFSKEEQALYDKAHISRDIRKMCIRDRTWTAARSRNRKKQSVPDTTWTSFHLTLLPTAVKRKMCIRDRLLCCDGPEGNNSGGVRKNAPKGRTQAGERRKAHEG